MERAAWVLLLVALAGCEQSTGGIGPNPRRIATQPRVVYYDQPVGAITPQWDGRWIGTASVFLPGRISVRPCTLTVLSGHIAGSYDGTRVVPARMTAFADSAGWYLANMRVEVPLQHAAWFGRVARYHEGGQASNVIAGPATFTLYDSSFPGFLWFFQP